MKNQTIRLRKKVVAKIFPEKYTKMRMEDFTNKAIDNKKLLNKREFDGLVGIRGEMSKGNIVKKEFYAKKGKKGIELIPF